MRHHIELSVPEFTWPSCKSIPGPEGRDVERYLVAYDIGLAVNPKLVEAQIVGGMRKGWAAHYSRSSVTTNGASRLSVNFADIWCRPLRKCRRSMYYSLRMHRVRSIRSGSKAPGKAA